MINRAERMIICCIWLVGPFCKAVDLDTSPTKSIIIGFTISEKGRVSSVQDTNGDIPVLTYSAG